MSSNLHPIFQQAVAPLVPRFPAPTPWTLEVHNLSEGPSAIIYDNKGWSVADHLREEQAATIVKAVNAHDALRAVVQKIVNNWGDLHHKDLMQGRAALALAEGK